MEVDRPQPKVYLVLALLSLGYFGKYFCTSNMYIVQDLFMKDEGITPQQVSVMFAIGYAASMIGKVVAGVLCDRIGGKLVILMSTAGFVVSTVLFSMIPEGQMAYPTVLILWACIGFFALGLSWVAVVAVATNWVPASHLGRLMAWVSMAPQLGDASARLTLAHFINDGWRDVFRIAAFSAVALAVPTVLFVGNTPEGPHDTTISVGSPTFMNTPMASVQAARKEKDQESYRQRLKKLFSNPFLWVLCLLSGSLYGTRTLFLLYSSSFLSATYCNLSSDVDECMHAGETLRVTAKASSAYTILGCVSVYLVGLLKDKLPMRHRGATLTLFVAPLFLILLFLMQKGSNVEFSVASSMVALIGFCLFGPYKVLGAVFAVDVGGKELKSTCTAFMGVFDNFFAMVMLLGKGAIGNDWKKMFSVLAVLSAISAACAAYIWMRDIRVWKQHRANEAEVPLL